MAYRFHRLSMIAAAFLLSQSIPVLHAEMKSKDCSYLVVYHSFANQFSGFLNVPSYLNSAPPGVGIVPSAGAGKLAFLPGGKITTTETISIASIGLMQDVELAGTYSLSWNTATHPAVCSGTMSLSGSMNGIDLKGDFSVVVSLDGQRLDLIATNQGLIVATTATRMNHAWCHNATVGGVFSSNASGWALGPPNMFPPEQTLAGYVPFAFGGILEFHPRVAASDTEFPDSPDGSAVVEGWDSGSMNGQPFQRVSKGWYKVNPDCTGTLMLRDNLGNPDFHLQMVVGKNGNLLNLVNVDSMPAQGATVPLFILGTTMNRMQD